MVRRFHRGFTAAEETELWDRSKRGELPDELLVSLHRRSIFGWLRMVGFVLSGGVAPGWH